MADLSTKIKEYLNTNNIENFQFGVDVTLQNDGNGDYIKEWNITEVSEPTLSQLDSYDTIADSNLKWKRIRTKRNILLAETDFYALSDVTMTTEMSNYRQALRDLPSSTSNPDDVVFPTKP